MTDQSASASRVERAIDAWLELGPTELSDQVIDRARAEVHRTRRRSRWVVGWSAPARRRAWLASALAVATVVVALVAIGSRLLPHDNVGGPQATQSPSPSPTTLPIISIGVLPVSGQPVFPGTYATRFDPALTLTVDKIVELDCLPGIQCRGSVDQNQPYFLDLEFGTSHGAEILFMRLDKVIDPAAPSKLIDPPADLDAWVHALPGPAVFGPSTPTSVGGISALQLDLVTRASIQVGAATGVTGLSGIARTVFRVVLLTVRGHLVLIAEAFAPNDQTHNAAATLADLKPLMDSLTWP